ncbi:MAG TPA: cupin domain-containing protein [Candidatus Dormibacteraeota bacterium]|nr:cupin domain-containing protein [Candidatus Dormibacteraeota bacterium]
MPIEVRRFGVGNRRPEGPPGSVGVTGQVIHSDEHGVVAELAFARGARLQDHSSPRLTWLVVIEGGGWASVGTERVRVAAGEAVQLPPMIEHGAWTDHSPMRALLVELGDTGESPAIVEGRLAGLIGPGDARPAKGEGQLRERTRAPRYDPDEGEPV